MFCVNVRCMLSQANFENRLFTLGRLRNYVSLTAQCAKGGCGAIKIINNSRSTIAKQTTMSRYSANTIVPHFKEFRMMEYDIIGFDLDCTLLRYNLNNMVVLEHTLLKEFLVNEKDYPKELLDHKFEADFLQKGLIIDNERGNILKLSGDGTILKAAHGTRFMEDDEICKVYGELRTWDVALQYINDPLAAWNGPITEKLRSLLDYFDIGAGLVFAQAVDIVDKVSSSKYTVGKNDYKIWPDILAGLIKIYTRENFETGESPYFEALKQTPHKYLLKTDDKVLNLLKELKASGKALYLLTGSNVDFANFTATYALGPQWRELFDYIICFAKKPGFFSLQRPFLKIRDLTEIEGSEISLNDELLPNNCYSQGNWQQLKASTCKHIIRKHPDQIRSLYVGDNLIQDVYAPKVMASIDILALSEELLENGDNYDFKSIVQSTLWGSYFSYDGKPTYWSKIIENYSQICISHIDVLAQIPAKEKIHCANKGGYFPNQPDNL